MIKLVVFDMAGTTVDEDNVVYKTLRKSINDAGFEVSLEKVLTLGAGKEKYQAIVDVLRDLTGGEAGPEKAKSIFRTFRENLKNAYDALDVKEQPGAGQVFAQLKDRGVKVALNTGYDRQTAESLLQKLHWAEGEQIDLLITASDVERGRPHPDMITRAMQTLGIESPEAVAKIGDSIIDIEEGQSAGCRTFGVTTGAHTREQLASANPDHVVDSLDAMLELI